MKIVLKLIMLLLVLIRDIITRGTAVLFGFGPVARDYDGEWPEWEWYGVVLIWFICIALLEFWLWHFGYVTLIGPLSPEKRISLVVIGIPIWALIPAVLSVFWSCFAMCLNGYLREKLKDV